MKRVIVAGANGFIGKMLTKELLERGYTITAIDQRYDDDLKNYVECIDIKDRSINEIATLLSQYSFDCFYDLAWIGTSGSLRADYHIQLENARMTCDYVHLSALIKCPRFIYASSINEMETYEYLQADDIDPAGGYIYGAGKLAAHLMAETVANINNVAFIPVIITNIFGAGERSARLIYSSIKKLLLGEHCSFTKGEQIYDFIYITDAINSIIHVAEKGKPFNRYYIGSGEPKPLKEFLQKMKDIVAPETELGLGDLPFKGVSIDYGQFDLMKVKADTGYINQISFEEGIQITAEYIKRTEKL